MPRKPFNKASHAERRNIVRQYVEQIIAAVEKDSIQSSHIRQQFAKRVREETKDADSFIATYAPINMALQEFPDQHSALIPPILMKKFVGELQQLPTARLCGDTKDIAYIKLTGCSPNKHHTREQYIMHCHQLIKDLEAQNPKGWIIDLRDNGGGECWPMLAGLGPLLEEKKSKKDGLLGYFKMRNEEIKWGYKNGYAWSGLYEENPSYPYVSFVKQPYHLSKPEPSVVVLMGPQTYSSAETICVAAFGLAPRVQVFGSESAGKATVNKSLNYDTALEHKRALIFFAGGTYLDRNKREYGYYLKPDRENYVADSGPEAPVPTKAINWLYNQHAVLKKFTQPSTATPVPAPP